MSLKTSDLKSAVPSVDAVPRTGVTAENQFVPSWRHCKGFIVFAGILVVVFCRPLLALLAFAPHAELYSHILLIPFISAFLIWMKRGQAMAPSLPNRPMAVLPFVIGVVGLAVYWTGLRKGWTFETPDYLAVMVIAFLCFLLGGALFLVQRNYLRSITFPVAFLFFCVPFPQFVRSEIEIFFQYGSADVAYVMLKLSGMSVLRDGTFFLMPGFSLNVQPPCSGIHSSLVLLITSCLAAYLFLNTPSKRWLLVLSVIPLALLRNGFRVFTLGQLGVHVDPLILETWFHHHGGPLFFGLSLIPFFLLLRYLIKCEARKQPTRAD